ncbi:MAG: carbohydrate binding domain-containing protein, partial [Planctomycetota bacterium]
DDGVRLWVDGELLVDNWVDRGAAEDWGTIDLIAGNTYSLVMEYYENTGGATAELRWSSPRTPKALVPQAALSLPVKASSPSPRSGSVDVIQHPILTWGAGQNAASHEVYFGTDQDAVTNATTASAEFKGTKALGSESYDPGNLAWGATYYWRVDEINTQNPDSPWTGNVWGFTTADFLKIDDFEGYTDNDAANEAIWQNWIDGFGVPGNGSQVGYVLPPYAEQTIVHGGNQSMPLFYDNTAGVKLSEAELTLVDARNWTEEGVDELSIWFRAMPGSLGSFVEAPAGTFTMTGSGTDIWDVGTAGDYRDEFHFAYKTLTGAGTIVARVMSVQNTDPWAKAGVMIRDTLEPGSKHAFACVTPGNGAASQGRIDTGGASFNTAQGGITAPHWVKLERTISGSFIVSHSANGTTWVPVTNSNPTSIQMASTVYVGLAVTAHNAGARCQAVFSNVTITGTVGAQWANQDIGIASNAAEPLYVAVSNATGSPAVVYNDNPNAAQLDVWTRWNIPLQQFADQGINLTNVDKLTIGLGAKGSVTAPGGSGTMFFDDIRLILPVPLDTSNKLANGGFEDGVLDPWGVYGNATAEVVTDLVDAAVPEAPIEGTYCLYVLVPEATANFWDAGLQPVGEVFEAGKQYTVSAFLKAKSGTLDINFKPELAESPWTGFGDQMITITDQWAEYSVTTPVFETDVSPAGFTFHIGSAVGGFWVDNVRFYEGEYIAP